MKATLAVLIAAASLGGARPARVATRDRAVTTGSAPPFAPSPEGAPFFSLGFRELAADLMYVRLVGYYPLYDSQPAYSAALAEAVAAMDPKFRRVYEFGAIAMTDARRTPDRELQLRAIRFLEKGMREFPQYGRFPEIAGEIYLSDLATDDPAQRRAWDEKGALLLETASRKPGGRPDTGLRAVELHSRLGKTQRAINSLRELLLLTNDPRARADIVRRLAEIEQENADEIAAELLGARSAFERGWLRERPTVSPSMYILIGPRLAPGFDLADLATGGRDLVGTEAFERLEPLYDEPATSADGPSSP